jgi:hypothetical protein
MKRRVSVDVVALGLVVVLGLGVVLICVIALVGIVRRSSPPTLGENTTQILTAILSGTVGVLGSYIGFRTRSNGKKSDDEPPSS